MGKTLTIRNVPDIVHAKLKRRAEKHRRSLNSEGLHLLEEATGEGEIDRDAVWEEIRRRREEGPTITIGPKELKRLMREGLA
jgi:plasmid stability protein